MHVATLVSARAERRLSQRLVAEALRLLGCGETDWLEPDVCAVLGAARAWLLAGLEAVFLTDEEAPRCAMERGCSEVSDVSEE